MDNGFTKYITIKNIIRALSVLLIIFFFVPSFMVSCSGVSVKFSAARAMVGVKYEGEKMSNASPMVVLLLLLPIAILVVWCLKNVIKDKVAAIIGTACAAADLIMWIVVRIGVASKAEDIFGTSKVLAGFVFNIIFVLGMIALNVLLLLNILQADKPLVGGGIQPNMQQNFYQSASTQDAPAAEPVVCANCGAQIPAGSKFCTKCGTKTE